MNEDINTLLTPDGRSIEVSDKDIIWNALADLRLNIEEHDSYFMEIGFPPKGVFVNTEQLDDVLQRLVLQYRK